MRRVYLDYAAATPIDKRVQKVMEKLQEKTWYNPSSLYKEAIEAREILEQSRDDIAHILQCRAGEVHFTAGGTEALNLSIRGVVSGAKDRGVYPHIIVSAIEHPAVLETVHDLANANGVELSIVMPNEDGIISAESIGRELKDNTVLVCLMHANNEVGTLQPVRKVAGEIKNYKLKIKNSSKYNNEPLLRYPYLLCDASQSTLYENVSLERLGSDLLVIDGIKMYGPRSSGVLVARHGAHIAPTVTGGGQERGLRSGTEDVVRAAALAAALKTAEEKREKESERLLKLRDYAISEITSHFPTASLNGSVDKRLPNNINICFPGTDSEFLVIKLDTLGFACSSASACSNVKSEGASYVLESLGKPGCAKSSLRFTLGRETKKSDIDKLIKALKLVL